MSFLLILAFVALAILWTRLRALEDKVARLEGAPVDRPAAEGDREGTWADNGTEAAAPEPAVSPQPVPPRPVPLPSDSLPSDDEAPRRRNLISLFETLVAGRLLVWLGGAALVVAGIFLIRHTIEIGLVTPTLRMIGAGLFAITLVVAGEYARRGKLLSGDPRFAQVLVGSGLALLYATFYGGHVLYGLIGDGTAFVAMLATTVAALALSLRHGAPTAAIGLIGGFIAPWLVGDPDNSALSLLVYLALLDLAIFLLAWKRGWTWLAACAVALSFIWTGLMLFGRGDDAIAAGFFIILLAIGASLSRPGPGLELRWIHPLAIGLVQLAILVARVDLGAGAWVLFAILAAASLGLAAARPEYRHAPSIALGLALLLLLARASDGTDPFVGMAAIGATLLFGAGGLALALVQRRMNWALLASAGFACPFIILRAWRPELAGSAAWGLASALLVLGPALLVFLYRGRAGPSAPADPPLLAASSSALLLAGAAAHDLVAPGWIVAAWLVLAIGAGLAARRLNDLAMATTAVAAAIFALCRALWTLPELSTAILTGLVGEPVLATDLPTAGEALRLLAFPAALLMAFWFVLPGLPLGARKAIPIAAFTFLAASLYIWFKQAFGLSSRADFEARGLIERTLVTQGLFLAGWLLGRGRIRFRGLEPDLLATAGAALTAVAATRLVWFDLLVHNPAWSAQWVGPMPFLNLVLPAYLLSAAFLYSARRRSGHSGRSGLWLATFLAALVGGVWLLVRQVFQGAWLNGPDLPIAEFYAYSLAGLLLSIALLLAGIRLPDKALRLSGLLLLTVTIFKVFLVDASELEGLLRILSFLGLGIALIGIARLYGPVLGTGSTRADPPPAAKGETI